jgi:hypothetical protein
MIDKMPEGLVVEEIHKTRRAIHDRFGGDVKAILADARKRQGQSSHPVWRCPTPVEAPNSEPDHGNQQ